MTDRELLELAAKAAGIELGWDTQGVSLRLDGSGGWNPLTSNGDVFELAVKLKIDVIFSENEEDAPWVEAGGWCTVWLSDVGGDSAAATRLAIVKAAADLETYGPLGSRDPPVQRNLAIEVARLANALEGGKLIDDSNEWEETLKRAAAILRAFVSHPGE